MICLRIHVYNMSLSSKKLRQLPYNSRGQKGYTFPNNKSAILPRKCKSLLSLFNKITFAVHTCYLDIQDLSYALFSFSDFELAQKTLPKFPIVLYYFLWFCIMFNLYSLYFICIIVKLLICII